MEVDAGLLFSVDELVGCCPHSLRAQDLGCGVPRSPPLLSSLNKAVILNLTCFLRVEATHVTGAVVVPNHLGLAVFANLGFVGMEGESYTNTFCSGGIFPPPYADTSFKAQ